MSALVVGPPIDEGRPARVAVSVRFTSSMFYVELTDGREIGAPLAKFPRLEQATSAQRAKWHIEPYGFAVYWDELDDGIEVDQLME